MRILISGACGFVGSTLARGLAQSGQGHEILGFDTFVRPGSETNREPLKRLGIKLFHCDQRMASDVDALPEADWVIDAAANPSVLAGVDGKSSSRQLVEHNLSGTVNILEYCKRHGSGLVLLSTSRVYSIRALASIPVRASNGAFQPDLASAGAVPGLGPEGISEGFSTGAPLSLYGATKLASEALALEYGEIFGLPVFVNRCGVLAGAGQFGRADQGIFAFWINSWIRNRPLTYIGFGGQGHQVRDCLHPADLLPLLARQLAAPTIAPEDRIVNLSGGVKGSLSLRQVSDWCASRFGDRKVASDPKARTFDIPWLVLDSSKAARVWGWKPETPPQAVFSEIADHAQAHPDWLETSAPL